MTTLVPTLRVGTQVPDALRPLATRSVEDVCSHAERGNKNQIQSLKSQTNVKQEILKLEIDWFLNSLIQNSHLFEI
jgi:hypothetical protein